MKLSGSTFLWLAGIGFVWGIGPARAVESGRWPQSPSRFAASMQPAVTLVASGTVERPRSRSVDYPRIAPALLRPDRQRVATLETARCPVEQVRISRTPALHRAGAVSLNRFVFRRSDSDRPGR